MDNFKEIFCTSISPSKNNFRARVPREPILPPRMVGGGFISPNMGKAVGDIEAGRKQAWEESGTGVGDYDGQLSNDEGLENKESGYGDGSPDLSRTLPAENMEGGRAVMHPRRSSWGRKSGSWEISPEVLALAAGAGDSNRIGSGSSDSIASVKR